VLRGEHAEGQAPTPWRSVRGSTARRARSPRTKRAMKNFQAGGSLRTPCRQRRGGSWTSRQAAIWQRSLRSIHGPVAIDPPPGCGTPACLSVVDFMRRHGGRLGGPGQMLAVHVITDGQDGDGAGTADQAIARRHRPPHPRRPIRRLLGSGRCLAGNATGPHGTARAASATCGMLPRTAVVQLYPRLHSNPLTTVCKRPLNCSTAIVFRARPNERLV
jgi:hypothetical protein